MLLTISHSESAYPITPVEPLKQRFWDNSEICLLFSRKHTHTYYMLLTSSYSESAYPMTPVELLKASLYDYIGIFFFLYSNL